MGLFASLARYWYADLYERAHDGPEQYAEAWRIIGAAARNGDSIAAGYAMRLALESIPPSRHIH